MDKRSTLDAMRDYIADCVISGDIERARSVAHEYAALRDSMLTMPETIACLRGAA